MHDAHETPTSTLASVCFARYRAFATGLFNSGAHPDLVVANAENVAGGSGITPENYRELIAAGVDPTFGEGISFAFEYGRWAAAELATAIAVSPGGIEINSC